MIHVAIAGISAALLAAEILLMRLLSIVQWHHFASMIISLALLGFGASGTALALARDRATSRAGEIFIGASALFGLTLVACAVLAVRVPFHALEILWDPRQILRVTAIYLLLAVPFFFAATAIGVTFMRWPDRIPALYRSNLVGSGIGALLVVPALTILTPASCLRLLGALGPLSAALFALAGGSRRGRGAALALGMVAIALAILGPSDRTLLRISPYKGLPSALRAEGAKILAERSGPLGWLAVVESPRVPFRYAPGLSLFSSVEPPGQLGLFADSEWLGPITRWDPDPRSLAYFDQMSSALPYHLLRAPRVLVLGAGSGAGVLQALQLGSARVDAVEMNAQVIDLLRGPFAAYAGHLYDRRDVRVWVAEGRRFAEAAGGRYDLIDLGLLDAFGAGAAGLTSVHESTLYTVEAFEAYLRRLRPGGLLAVTRWLTLPPRDALKLVATASDAIRRSGGGDPARRIAVVRSLRTVTILVKNGDFAPADRSAIRSFCAARSFDVEYVPGMAPGEANRVNVLAEAWLSEGTRALLGPEHATFIARYKFRIEPATDDRPYFLHFFRWGALAEILALRGQGGLALGEWGYPLLVATLLQAILAGAVLILLPLRALGSARTPARDRLAVAIYFAALGFGFLFIEMAFLQRFVLFLGDPLHSASIVLASFLVFAGLGSASSERLARAGGALRALRIAGGTIVVLAAAYLLFLPSVLHPLMAASEAARVVLSIALIAPLAFFMGVPFPLGLSRVSAAAPALLPWAWAINGCASVAGAVLAPIVAMEAGFTGVVALAILLYPLAALLLGRFPAGSPRAAE